jgi:hypothetical protein
MTLQAQHAETQRPGRSVTIAAADTDLRELVDAVAQAVDTDRSWEVERVVAALEAFGGAAMAVDELRLNGRPSCRTCDLCDGGAWL